MQSKHEKAAMSFKMFVRSYLQDVKYTYQYLEKQGYNVKLIGSQKKVLDVDVEQSYDVPRKAEIEKTPRGWDIRVVNQKLRKRPITDDNIGPVILELEYIIENYIRDTNTHFEALKQFGFI